jgi:hypothetical protein
MVGGIGGLYHQSGKMGDFITIRRRWCMGIAFQNRRQGIHIVDPPSRKSGKGQCARGV